VKKKWRYKYEKIRRRKSNMEYIAIIGVATVIFAGLFALYIYIIKKKKR
jgi:hypothetical protein